MKYEMLILLKSDMSEEAIDAELKKYTDIVESFEGSVESLEKWGVKKMAYPISYKSDAFFALMKFTAKAEAVNELNRVAGISQDVLRRMITKVEEK